MFTKVGKDERSDDEESEMEDMNGEATKLLENDTGMKTDSPVVLVNGEALKAEAKPEGIKQRRKKR